MNEIQESCKNLQGLTLNKHGSLTDKGYLELSTEDTIDHIWPSTWVAPKILNHLVFRLTKPPGGTLPKPLFVLTVPFLFFIL